MFRQNGIEPGSTSVYFQMVRLAWPPKKNGDPKIAVTKRQMILKNQDYLYTLT
jgi:hypothetical protein